MAGLTDTGLEIKTQPEIQAELEETQKGSISDRLNFQADGAVGQLNGLFSDALASVWELIRDVYSSAFPNLSRGFSLAQLVQLTGTKKRAATKSRVAATVNVDPGTYPIGSLVASVDVRPDDRFTNTTEVVNIGLTAANVATTMEAETAGAIQAPAGSLVIAEPYTGWNSITTSVDATIGLEEETDSELRARRELEIASGSATADAIRAAILRKLSSEGVTSVRVVFNDEGTVSPDGLPGHSFECIVQGPDPATGADDAALAAVIQENKTDGIQAYGTTIVAVQDEQGNDISIGFTRPSDLNIYADFDVNVDAATYAGDAALKAAIVEWAQDLEPGEDVSFYKVSNIPFTVAGVEDVTDASIGLSASPTGKVSLAVGLRQIAKFDTSRITVTSTPV